MNFYSGNEIESQTYECLECGGIMDYDSDVGCIQCNICGSVRDIKDNKKRTHVKEYIFVEEKDEDFKWQKEKMVLKCDRCDGQVLVDVTEEPIFCAFCGPSYIMKPVDVKPDLDMVPHAILPFVLTAEEAMYRLTVWVQENSFRPSDLRISNLRERTKGMYIPYWIYSFKTDVLYGYQTRAKRKLFDEIEHFGMDFSYSGNVQLLFKNIMMCSVNNSYLDALREAEPFDLSDLVEFKEDYLDGRYAQTPMLNQHTAFAWVNTDMTKIVERIVKSEYTPYNHPKINYDQRIKYYKITAKQVWVPMYIYSYTYKNKKYPIVVNGQTGEVTGEVPKDIYKVLAVIVSIVAAFVIYILLLVKFYS